MILFLLDSDWSIRCQAMEALESSTLEVNVIKFLTKYIKQEKDLEVQTAIKALLK